MCRAPPRYPPSAFWMLLTGAVLFLLRVYEFQSTSKTLWSFSSFREITTADNAGALGGGDHEPSTTTTSTTSMNISQQQQQQQPLERRTRKWAYASLVGGCNPEEPSYRGFLYSVAVSSYRLQHELGSQADFCLWIQMSATSNHTRLPTQDVQVLEAANVQIRYLPKLANERLENFYALCMEKFRIASMLEYSRVLFLDSDVFPLQNLDYIFALSDRPSSSSPSSPSSLSKSERGTTSTIKENMVISQGKNEPSNAGFFMFKPSKGDFEEIQEIILRTEKNALTIEKSPFFDPIQGYGHVIVPPDHWIGKNNRSFSTNWTFHGSHADQGFLYHWTKYMKQNVTIIAGNIIQHWRSSSSSKNDGTTAPYLESTTDRIEDVDGKVRDVYSDFRHYTGRDKPWLGNRTTERELNPHYRDWFSTLRQLEIKVNRTLEYDGHPPLGAFPFFLSRLGYIREKKSRNWNQYDEEVLF